jgi:four helix bundle protein
MNTFEDLIVYQESRKLINEVYAASNNGEFSKDYGLKNQARKAVVSIAANIAEGFERGSNTEFVQFLYIAKGSCGELRAELGIACDQKYMVKSEYEQMKEKCIIISSMLSNFIKSLRKSGFKGPKR